MKTFILTPVKPVKSEFEKNYEILLNYVQQNFEGLLIGAKRRGKLFSNRVNITDNDNVITIKKGDLAPISISKHCLTYNISKVDSENNLHEIYNEIIVLKNFAEDLQESKYSYTIEKPRIVEDIF